MRLILLATVFLSGGALMSLEMVSFRLVEPFYGSDITVWGSLISVFLGGLAMGAIVGGALADHRPRLWKLASIIAAGGVVTLALTLYAAPLMDALFPKLDMSASPHAGPASAEDSADHLVVITPTADLKWPTLLVSLILFGPPTLLLGMVSPYAARLYVHGMADVGTDVGRLYGISTIGSIIGTLGTAFYLISWLGTRALLEGNGELLVGLGAVLVAIDVLVGKLRRAAT